MTPAQILSQPTCHLAQAQRELFYDQGYLTLPELIDKKQLNRLRMALANVVDASRAISHSNNRIDLEKGHSAQNPRLRRATYLDDIDAAFWELCADSVITDIAADILGPNIRFRDLMANFKWAHGGAEVKWHQDLPFYPHTNAGTCQFLLMLEDVDLDQGPLQVIPSSHKGPIFEHYDEAGEWTATIREQDLINAGIDRAVALTGSAGSATVHHSCTIHGSAQNTSASGRPVLVISYSAADAIAYTAAPYPSSHYGTLVRGVEPRYAHHQELNMPLPPDWSDGYTSIFSHQDIIR
jgi:ectoine hydroxylase-related dioxygenase (phytanoyl-CoA dioxygenase family)